MRTSEISRFWRKSNELNNFNFKLRELTLHNLDGFESEFSFSVDSSITAICGKNGVGKTTLLRAIYQGLKQQKINSPRFGEYTVDFVLEDQKGKKVDFESINHANVHYIDPFDNCSKIRAYLTTTDNVEELLEGVDYSPVLNNDKIKGEIGNIVGKNYRQIEVYELEELFPHDPEFIVPFFKVTTSSGIEYNSLEMGTGELICLYIAWFLHWIENNSILFIEEIENSLSAYSQKLLMDYLAKISVSRKAWCLITSHSEYVLGKVGLTNTRVLCELVSGVKIVKPLHQSKYLRYLGINPQFRGGIMLEDSCALAFCKELVNRFNPFLLKEKELFGLGGESNIEKVVKHFQPHKKPDYDLIAVFDADMGQKVKNLTSFSVPVASLPSKNGYSPEVELWEHLVAEHSKISDELSLDKEELFSLIDINQARDHHDRLKIISDELEISVDRFRAIIIKNWIDENLTSAAEFVLALSCSGARTEVSDIISQISIMEKMANVNLLSLRNVVESAQHEKVKLTYLNEGLQISI